MMARISGVFGVVVVVCLGLFVVGGVGQCVDEEMGVKYVGVGKICDEFVFCFLFLFFSLFLILQNSFFVSLFAIILCDLSLLFFSLLFFFLFFLSIHSFFLFYQNV